GHADVLGEAALHVLAQDAVADAKALLALPAVFAAAAVKIGIYRHAIAHGHAARGRARLHDVAGDVAAHPEGEGELEAGQALPHEEVERTSPRPMAGSGTSW